jgi:acyl carrier protein
MASIVERVTGIVADKLGIEVEKVTLEASFTEQLNADSLDLVELIMAFEEEFSESELQVEISDEAAEKILTVGDAVEFLKNIGVKE